MVEIVPMPHPLRPGPVEIDDSRLQTLWARQNRRNMWIVGAGGATALLVGAALVIMALRFNAEPPVVNVAPPVVNVPEQPAPVVNVTVPQQPAPVVNVTPNIEVKVPPQMPQAPVMPSRPGETGKVVTEHTIFHNVTVGKYEMFTGWKFHNSNDDAPYSQYCMSYVGPTGLLRLAVNGDVSPTLATDARALGVGLEEAKTLVKSCRWFGQ